MSHPTHRPSAAGRRAGWPTLSLGAGLVALAGIGLWLASGADELPPLPAPVAHAVPATGAAGAARTASPTIDREVPAELRGCWTAPAGSSFRHHLADRCDVELRSAEGGSQPGGRLQAECEVATTVLDRRDGEVLVRQQIEGLRFVGADGRTIENDPIQQHFAAAAQAPVLVRLGPVGQILGFGFAAGLDGDQRNFLRGTLGLFAFEAPPRDVSTWTSEAIDTTGHYDARYQVLPTTTPDDVAVRRTRERYTAVTGQEQVPEHQLRGAAEACFATRLGWLRSAHLDEGMTMSLPLLDLQAVTARKAEITLLANGTTAIDVDLAAAWQCAEAAADGRGEQLGGLAAGSERRLWAERLQGVTLDQLLADLRRVLAADPVDAEALDGTFQKLHWLVRLDDRNTAVLVEQLTTRQLGDDVARVVLGALGAAGTPAAQDALAAVRGDASLGEPVREAATIACIQLAAPNAKVVAGLALEAGSTSGLRGSSMLVLGAIAPRADTALADGRTPLQHLLAMEGAAEAHGELDTWMLAVGNSQAPATFAIAQRLLGHVSASVRASACVALRGVQDPAAVTALVQRGLTDSDAGVRYEAVLALGRRPEPAARTALQQAAQSDPVEQLRRKAQDLLQAGS